jgi:hypothetical protein
MTIKSGFTGITGVRTKLAGKGSLGILPDGTPIKVSLDQSMVPSYMQPS